MLHQISWQLYIETISGLAIIYYAVIALKFYRAELTGLFNRKPKDSAQPATAYGPLFSDEPENKATLTTDDEVDDTIDQMEKLIGSLKSCVASSSNKPANLLLPQIRNIFGNYPEFIHSPHRPAINELVVSECAKTGISSLTEYEIDQLWDQDPA